MVRHDHGVPETLAEKPHTQLQRRVLLPSACSFWILCAADIRTAHTKIADGIEALRTKVLMDQSGNGFLVWHEPEESAVT